MATVGFKLLSDSVYVACALLNVHDLFITCCCWLCWTELILLIIRINFDIICQNFYTASNLKDLFHNIHPKHIISFVHVFGLTNKL